MSSPFPPNLYNSLKNVLDRRKNVLGPVFQLHVASGLIIQSMRIVSNIHGYNLLL